LLAQPALSSTALRKRAAPVEFGHDAAGRTWSSPCFLASDSLPKSSERYPQTHSARYASPLNMILTLWRSTAPGPCSGRPRGRGPDGRAAVLGPVRVQELLSRNGAGCPAKKLRLLLDAQGPAPAQSSPAHQHLSTVYFARGVGENRHTGGGEQRGRRMRRFAPLTFSRTGCPFWTRPELVPARGRKNGVIHSRGRGKAQAWLSCTCSFIASAGRSGRS
jgi:hypothetical protein